MRQTLPPLSALPLGLMLAGCASTDPSHIPNPLALPGQAITTGVQNASYQSRRARVELHVKTHHPALIAQITAGGGPELTQAMDLARVAARDRDILLLRLQSERQLYSASPDALVVALMVHGH